MKNKALIRYSNCWEDTDNLLDNLEEQKNILSICSGGDNTLAMLLKNPKRILAFDLNINQIYLLKLKVCAMQNLKYEEVLILLGVKDGDAYQEFVKIKNKLKKETREFFTENKNLFKIGIINCGKFENYFQLFRKYICPIFATRKQLEKFAYMSDIEEQRKYYKDVINNRRLNLVFNAFFGFRVMGKYGRDKAFYDHVPEKERSAIEIRRRFDNGINSIPNRNNPYINYILLNRFSDDCLPIYLQPKNYKIIKQRLGRIEYVHGSMLDVTGKFDFLNLSDIFEYMSEEILNENLSHLKKITNPSAKIIYYNMQGKKYLPAKTYKLNENASQKGFKKSKAYFYRDFLVYQKVAK